jgi:hypothetical protein
MTIIPNNYYLITPRHEGYDIVRKCHNCGYSYEHLEFSLDDVWPEEFSAIMWYAINSERGTLKLVPIEDIMKEIIENEED